MSPVRDHRRPRPEGFTPVELVVVLLVIGILASVAVPKFVATTERAAAQAVLSDIDGIFTAVELNVASHGRWPANSLSGQLPPDLEGLIDASAFTQTTPIGGKYDWNGPGTYGSTLGVEINDGEDVTKFRLIDQLGDNGDLNSGWITRYEGDINFEIGPRE